MPANKDHHYVSQFYLRNFGTGNSIALFNIRQQRYVPTAAIPGQCQRSYFYGRDGVTETKLQGIESAASNAIRAILATGKLPTVDGEEHRALTMFISFQLARTPNAVAVMRRMQERLGDAHVKTFAELAGQSPSMGALEDMRASWWAPLPESLKNAEELAPLLLDLRPVLLTCPEGHAFVASDGPAVLFNPWCRGWTATGVTGLMSSGLIAFLPLSPKYLLLLVDDEVYAIAESAIRRAVDERDVKGLNSIQLLGAEHNLYFRDDGTTLAAIEDLPLRWNRPRVDYVRVRRARSELDDSFLIFFYQEQPDVRLDLRFLQVRPEKRDVPLRERAHSWRARAREAEPRSDQARTSLVPGQRWSFIPEDTER